MVTAIRQAAADHLNHRCLCTFGYRCAGATAVSIYERQLRLHLDGNCDCATGRRCADELDRKLAEWANRADALCTI